MVHMSLGKKFWLYGKFDYQGLCKCKITTCNFNLMTKEQLLNYIPALAHIHGLKTRLVDILYA